MIKTCLCSFAPEMHNRGCHIGRLVDAARREAHHRERTAAALALGWPYDCIATTREMVGQIADQILGNAR